MLENLIVVDYVDGAGGEFISSCINHHANFYCESPNEFYITAQTNKIQKYFNSQELIGNNINSIINEFLNLCEINKVKNVAVSYHLYKRPANIEIIKNNIQSTRFVAINHTDHNELINLDFVRKVYFNRITKKDLNTIKFRITNFDDKQKKLLFDLLRSDRLIEMDFDLIAKNIIPNYDSRLEHLNNFIKRRKTPPSKDLEINYENFFVNLDNLKESYYNLCEQLNIVPIDNVYELIFNRNKKNFDKLNEFIKNFENIKNQVLSI